MNLIEDYKNNWLTSVVKNNVTEYRFSDSVLERIKEESHTWTIESLTENYNQAVQSLCDKLGDNIFVALSGGIDSQLVCLSLNKNNIKYTAAVMIFENDYNIKDVTSAVAFCQLHDINYVTIKFNIIDFLSKKLNTYVNRYQCSSPQFSAHFCFYEKLIEQYNPTAIICGGASPYQIEDKWVYGITSAQRSWINFKSVNQFNLIGDFPSYDFDLSLLLMMTNESLENFHSRNQNINRREQMYDNFVTNKKLAGFDVTPQELKLTGFEELKVYYNELFNKLYVFDLLFREPHRLRYPDYLGKLILDDNINYLLVSAAERIVRSVKHKYR